MRYIVHQQQSDLSWRPIAQFNLLIHASEFIKHTAGKFEVTDFPTQPRTLLPKRTEK